VSRYQKGKTRKVKTNLVKVNKTKVIICGERQKDMQKAVYSVLIAQSGYWVHRKCSGIKGLLLLVPWFKGGMYKVIKMFICRGCVNPVTS